MKIEIEISQATITESVRDQVQNHKIWNSRTRILTLKTTSSDVFGLQ